MTYGINFEIDGHQFNLKVVDKDDRDEIVRLAIYLEETGKHGGEVVADYQELD